MADVVAPTRADAGLGLLVETVSALRLAGWRRIAVDTLISLRARYLRHHYTNGEWTLYVWEDDKPTRTMMWSTRQESLPGLGTVVMFIEGVDE